MIQIARRWFLIFACTAGMSPVFANPPAVRAIVIVHGTVLDYAGRPVEKARVSFNGLQKPIETDAKGQFTTQAPQRAFVSASKHDMLGHVVLGDAAQQTVTIRMAQMPM